MHPETARAILQAMRNHHRPPRTHAARAMDALAHVNQSIKERPARARISAGLNIGKVSDENSTLPADKNHPAPHL